MKPRTILPAIVLTAMLALATVCAEAAKVTVKHRSGPRHRTSVTIRTGHPIHRPMHSVVVRRPAMRVRVTPAIFLPAVVWAPAIIARPAPDYIVWQDSETLEREDDWAEVVFNSDQRGERVYLEVVSGRAQFDFAEVVFDNGECQVVDFNEETQGTGIYLLLDFKNGRKLDHVRLVARARTDESRIALVMAK